MNKRFISLFILLLLSTSLALAVSVKEANGPFILTDFDFNKTYENNANVDFYCLGSQNYPTNCIIQSQYEIDGIKYNFNFNEYTLFNFNGTKEITVYAKNDINNTTTKTFTLTINKTEASPTVTQTTTNNSTSTAGPSYPASNSIPPTLENTTAQENNSNPEVTTTHIQQDILNFNQNTSQEKNEVLTNIEISRGTAYFTLPFAFEQKHGVFIGLVAIIIIMSIALVLIPKKVKK